MIVKKILKLWSSEVVFKSSLALIVFAVVVWMSGIFFATNGNNWNTNCVFLALVGYIGILPKIKKMLEYPY